MRSIALGLFENSEAAQFAEECLAEAKEKDEEKKPKEDVVFALACDALEKEDLMQLLKDVLTSKMIGRILITGWPTKHYLFLDV